MLFRPKFCSNCGEKIERIEWRLWTSRRFCDLCATEHRAAEFALPVFAAIILVGLVAAISSRPSEVAMKTVPETRPSQQVRTLAAVPTEAGQKAITSATEQPSQTIVKPSVVEKPVVVAASIYTCGAETKKGTACSRRVKGNVRCFQHTGMPPMVPSEKLKIG